MFEVYINDKGHLMPVDLTLPKERGISTFIDCAYVASTNTAIVDTSAASIKAAVCGSPRDNDWNSAGIAPVMTSGFVGDGNGDRALTTICNDTSAAMNNEIPDPNPHLDITSSMYMTRIPPRNSCAISANSSILNVVDPASAGSGASPPISTYIAASNAMKNRLNTFCVAWNLFLPSDVVNSKFTIPDPFNSCNTMLDVTSGPIPSDNIDPNDAPNMIERNSNCWSSF